MRILYLANHGNTGSDDTEGHIAHSITKLGCEVVKVQQREAAKILTIKADWLLFHKCYDVPLLKQWDGKKVVWFFDKVDFNGRGREEYLRNLGPVVDAGFVTDETWLRLANIPKYKVLRQGVGDRDLSPGKVTTRWGAKIAFLGSLYGERGQWLDKLKKRFPGAVESYGDVFNRDLYDLCATVPIIVAPPTPGDDHYWSSRIYMTLGSGGFLIHPRYRGLKQEYVDGVDYVGYDSQSELDRKIQYYLEHPVEREVIRAHGYKTTITKFTYTDRCRKLLKVIQPPAPTGTKE